MSRQVRVYAANVPLQSGKTVAYLTLPNISDGVSNGQAAMHVFAVSIGGYGTLQASPPSVMAVPGTPSTVSATFTNSGQVGLDTLALSLQLPNGWTVQPTTSTSFTDVVSGEQVSAAWQVTAPAGAAPGRGDGTVQATYSAHGAEGVTATSVGFVQLPIVTGGGNGGDKFMHVFSMAIGG